MKPLSARQLEVLETLQTFAAREGHMPSVRELARALGRAPSTVQQHLDALAGKGWLERDGQAHGLALTGQPALAEGTLTVPVVGRIAAGAPIEALEAPEDPIALPVSLALPGSFALRVKGDSMVDDHILDGDLVVVRPQPTVENGEIAVCVLPDGTATLKRLFRERGRFRLQPANARMAPLVVDEVRVQGRVTGVVRRIGPPAR